MRSLAEAKGIAIRNDSYSVQELTRTWNYYDNIIIIIMILLLLLFYIII